MSQLIKPIGYEPLLDTKQTEQGIKLIKEFFQQNISTELRLRRVTAPLFVLQGLGINDDLNGVERAVTFPIKDLGDARAEVVHSLAKWKRLSLAEYKIAPGYGIYTDMNAIRADEELDNLHSLYVDQWDWEAVVTKEQRTVAYLKNVVERIYAAIRRTEYLTCETYPQIKPFLPEQIKFIHAEELLQMYRTRRLRSVRMPFVRSMEQYLLLVLVVNCRMARSTTDVLRTMTTGQRWVRMGWQDSMVTFLSGILYLDARLNCLLWVSVSTRSHCCAN